VKKLEPALSRAGIVAKSFHSDLDQAEREVLMQGFKSRRIPILIGTDVLSRGIDVEGIELVVNYDVPPDPEDYVHRIGRTARAERTGTAITFINDQDQSRFARIESLIGREIEKLPLPEGYGPAPVYNPRERRRDGGRNRGGGKGGNRKRPHKGGPKGGGNGRPKGSPKGG
jgi:ATP-dependent RNA helicase RhlE